MATRTLSYLFVGTDRLSAVANRAGRNVESASARMGAAFGRMADNAARASAGITIASVKLATDYEASMDKINALVGINRRQVDQWSKQLLSLGPKVGKSPKELADALFFITSAGLRGSKALDALTASAKASEAGLGDTKTVADAVTSAMNAYSKAHLKAADVTDTLVAAVREGKMPVDALAEAIGGVLPAASEVGVSFAEVAGTAAALSRSGGNVRQTMTGIRFVLTNMVKPTQAAVDVLAKYGMTADELRKSIRDRGLLATLQDLKKRMPIQDFLELVGGARGVITALGLVGQNSKQAAEVMRNVSKAAGSTDRAFDSVSKTAKFKLDQALSGLKANGIKLGTTLLPIFASLLDHVRKFADYVMNLPHGWGRRIIEVGAALYGISKLGVLRPVLQLAGKSWELLASITKGGTSKLAADATLSTASTNMQTAATTMLTASENMLRAAGATSAGGAAGAAGAAGGLGKERGKVPRPATLSERVGRKIAPLAGAGLWGAIAWEGTGVATHLIDQLKGVDAASQDYKDSVRQLDRDMRHQVDTQRLWNTTLDASGQQAGDSRTATERYAATLNDVLTSSRNAAAGANVLAASLAGDKLSASAALSITDRYTEAIIANGAKSQAAGALREELIADFRKQGMSAKQAQDIVSAYTSAIESNGKNAEARRVARQNLINDFINSGSRASTAARLVDAMSKSVSGNGTASSNANAARKNLINDLIAVGVKAPIARRDVDNYSIAVRDNGAKSDAAKKARDKLMADLRNIGMDSQTAAGLVSGLTSALSKVPGSKTTTLKLAGVGTISLRAEGAYIQGESGHIKAYSSSAYAGGTRGAVAGWGIVGERGPELVKFAGGEQVIPNRKLRGYAGGTPAADLIWMQDTAGRMAGHFETGAARTFARGFAKALIGMIGTGAIAGLGGASGAVTAWILAAMTATGAPGAWLRALQVLVSKESGGNPRAWNPTPVNGEHASGLFQTLPSTFAAYATVPGGIWNPIANAVAGIRYIMSRYGSPYNIPNLFSRAYRGYGTGGLIAEPIIGVGRSGRRYVFGESGIETVVPGRGGITINQNFGAGAIRETADVDLMARRLGFAISAGGFG